MLSLWTHVLGTESETIERVSNLAYLGVVLDHHFNWKMHIDSLCKKLATAFFALFKCCQYFYVATLRTIYFAIFHSRLSYCIETWGHTHDSYTKPLIVLQKHATLLCQTQRPQLTLFSQDQIMPLQQLYKLQNTGV